jgi:hypothetical protein
LRSAIPTVSKNTSFSLGEHFSSFVEAQAGQGRYNSVSDVVRGAGSPASWSMTGRYTISP